jgi:hypothetical protein
MTDHLARLSRVFGGSCALFVEEAPWLLALAGVVLVIFFLVGCATSEMPPEQVKALNQHQRDNHECRGIAQSVASARESVYRNCMRARGYHQD